MKKSIMLIILIAFLSSCTEKEEFIEIGISMSDDPNEPRKGIYLNNKNTLNYCIEVRKYKKYEYFSKKLDTGTWDKVKTMILSSDEFKLEVSNIPHDHEFYYEFHFKIKDELSYRKIESSNLSKENIKILINLFNNLKSDSLHKINYFPFYSKVLTEELPCPPLIEKQ